MSDGEGLGQAMRAAMFARRIVMLSGVVDQAQAGDVVAGLLSLDALGDGAIELRVDGHCDSLDVALLLMDTIDALGVEVRVVCSGILSGTLVGLLAVAGERVMSPHARIRLCEPAGSFEGRASEIGVQAAHERTRLADFQARLAERTRRPLEHIEADMQTGRYLTGAQAQAYGLVDAVLGADAGRDLPT
ncbi:MAG: ClpP family protease [Acidimicrobiales bacterium]